METNMCACVCIDRYVILGGHRDAWVFGGIDPMSGAAVVHETVRSAGRLLSKGTSLQVFGGVEMISVYVHSYLIFSVVYNSQKGWFPECMFWSGVLTIVCV